MGDVTLCGLSPLHIVPGSQEKHFANGEPEEIPTAGAPAKGLTEPPPAMGRGGSLFTFF